METWDILTPYELYVLLLRGFISVTIAVSILVSCSRLLNVLKFIYYSLKGRLWKRPEHFFAFKNLPEDVSSENFSDPFPHVAVQVRHQVQAQQMHRT